MTSDAVGTESSAESSRPPTLLRRAITGPLLFVFILGDVLGAGIYALMGVLAEDVGGVLWLPLVVALGLALLTAGSYAELVTKYPRAGGSAVFAERAFRQPLISFLVGFSMLAAGVVSAAGLSLAFAGDYLGAFLGVPAIPAAIVFLALVALLNARGIRESLTSNLVMTAIEVTGLVVVVVCVGILLGAGEGMFRGSPNFRRVRTPHWRPSRRPSSPTTRSSVSRRRPTWSKRCTTRRGSTRKRCSAPSSRRVSSTPSWGRPVPSRSPRVS